MSEVPSDPNRPAEAADTPSGRSSEDLDALFNRVTTLIVDTQNKRLRRRNLRRWMITAMVLWMLIVVAGGVYYLWGEALHGLWLEWFPKTEKAASYDTAFRDSC